MPYNVDDFQKLKDYLLTNNTPSSPILLMLLALLLRKVRPVSIGEGLEPTLPSKALLNEYQATMTSLMTADESSEYKQVLELFRSVVDFAIEGEPLDFKLTFFINKSQEFPNLEDKLDILLCTLSGYFILAFKSKQYSAEFAEEMAKAIRECSDQLYTKYIHADNQQKLKELQSILSAVNFLRLRLVRFFLPFFPNKEIYELYFTLLQYNLFYSQQLIPFCAEMVEKSTIFLSYGERERVSSKSEIIYFLSAILGTVLLEKDDEIDFLQALNYTQRLLEEDAVTSSDFMTVTDLTRILLAFYLVERVYRQNIDDNANLKKLRGFLEQIKLRVSKLIDLRKDPSLGIFTSDIASIVITYYLQEISEHQSVIQADQTSFNTKLLKIQSPFSELLLLLVKTNSIEQNDIAAIINFSMPHEAEASQATSASAAVITPAITSSNDKKRSKGKGKASFKPEETVHIVDKTKEATREAFHETEKKSEAAPLFSPPQHKNPPSSALSELSVADVSSVFQSSLVFSPLKQKVKELAQLGENFRLGSLAFANMGLFEWIISLQSALIYLDDCIESITKIEGGRVLLERIFGENFRDTIDRFYVCDIKDFRHWFVHNPTLLSDFQASGDLRRQFKLIVDSLAKLSDLKDSTENSIISVGKSLDKIIFRPILTMSKPDSTVVERNKKYSEYHFNSIADLRRTDFPILLNLAHNYIYTSEPNKIVTEGLLARIGELVGHSYLAHITVFKPLVYWRNFFLHIHLEKADEDERNYRYQNPTEKYNAAVDTFKKLCGFFWEEPSLNGVHFSPNNPRVRPSAEKTNDKSKVADIKNAGRGQSNRGRR